MVCHKSSIVPEKDEVYYDRNNRPLLSSSSKVCSFNKLRYHDIVFDNISSFNNDIFFLDIIS